MRVRPGRRERERRQVGCRYRPGRLLAAVVTRARPPTVKLWRRLLLARAVEQPNFPAGPLLVLAPHPDDETLGCGATIARRRAYGDRVIVVVATDGRFSHTSDVLSPDDIACLRNEEVLEATARIGVPAADVVRLDYVEGTLGENLGDLAGRLVALIDEHACRSVLVTCSLDWHPDHQFLAAAARLSVSRAAMTPDLAEFPVWAWAEGPGPRFGAAGPRVRAALRGLRLLRRGAAITVPTSGYLHLKRRALMEYRSQTTNLTGEPDWAVMDEGFLGQFLGDAEIFFPVTASRPWGGGPRSGR